MPTVPDVTSPSWGSLASPLLDCLKKSPASIKQILKRARRHRLNHDLARNAMAWLSLTGKAYFDDRDQRWRAGCILEPAQVYVPSQASKPDKPIDWGKLLSILGPHAPPSPFLRISQPREEQSRSRKGLHAIRSITLGDRTLSVKQWSLETGLSPSTIHGRLASGWPPERILGEPHHGNRLSLDNMLRANEASMISPGIAREGSIPSLSGNVAGEALLTSPAGDVAKEASVPSPAEDAAREASVPSPAEGVDGKDQASTKKSIQLTHDGETLTVSQWARKLGLAKTFIYSRLRLGWPADRALGAAVQAWRRGSIARATESR
jgi:predicted DNA-binding transcriptional regulator AlpA